MIIVTAQLLLAALEKVEHGVEACRLGGKLHPRFQSKAVELLRAIART